MILVDTNVISEPLRAAPMRVWSPGSMRSPPSFPNQV
jgi:predicted nucleic acid-binding protein